ncbi:MAG: sulfatase-like hydrolase/transferase [Clostridia bacterium]|nr:sulfatase-like hydrolase/transferase [Clostridia bacterium]
MKRKNILFFFTDQQRYDTFNSDIMPELSSLASEGITFDNCFTCQPVCGPARACLQSGLYASETGCYKNGISLPRNIKPLAEYFNEAGYDTAYIGKWHLASDLRFNCEKTAIPKERLGGYRYFRGSDVLEFTSHGYDGYIFDEDGNKIDFKGYRADCITDFALEYIDNCKEDKPFFMFLSHIEPHHQNDRHRYEGYKETVDNYKGYPIPEDLKFLKGDYEKSYPDYLSAINRLDYNLGRLVSKLKEKNLYDDTIIIFTSDHGCHFKTRNAEYKRSCHDSSIHIPLVISGGSFKDGKVDRRLVSLLDLPATVLSLGGVEIPQYFRGHSLVEDSKRDNVYIEISESQCARAIRTERYTYSVSALTPISGIARKSAKVYFENYLYDNENDPYQRNNLVKNIQYKDVREMLRKELIKEMKKAGEKDFRILPAIKSKRI